VHVLKAYASFCQFIKAGGLALGVAEPAQCGAEVIGHQEKDVDWLFFNGSRNGAAGEKCRNKQERETGHCEFERSLERWIGGCGGFGSCRKKTLLTALRKL